MTEWNGCAGSNTSTVRTGILSLMVFRSSASILDKNWYELVEDDPVGDNPVADDSVGNGNHAVRGGTETACSISSF